jgi:hypothetical protein
MRWHVCCTNALTGEQPYPGESMEQQIAGHLSLDPPRPSSHRAGEPIGFDAVIARGMAKKPDQRYQTAQELAAAARAALAESTAPVPSSVWAGYPPPQPGAATLGWAPTLPATPQPFAPVALAEAAAPGRVRRRWLLVGGVGAAMIAAAAIAVVATVSLVSRQTTPSANTTSTRASAAMTPDRLDSVLLSVQDVNAVMGATAMEAQPISHGLIAVPPGTISLSNPDCYPTFFSNEQSMYANSGYTAASAEKLSEMPTFTHMVNQALVSFSSEESALAFVTNAAAKWRACAGQTIGVTMNMTNGRSLTLHHDVGDVVGDPPTIAQVHKQKEPPAGFSCQHVLSAVSNVVIDVVACGFQITDQARQIVDKMAANVP